MDLETLDIEKTLKYLTLEEKIKLLSGDGMWHTFGAGELPRVRMSDGPNGLRMTDGAMGSAVPSTCYPTSSMLANSWDPALLYSVGVGLGREATAMGVNLLLAPGVNIKRHPLGGRNFEYFSEDPFLSGELGKAYIRGVQATGVGACIKHFAANNQEDRRMSSDSVIDERALFELYLRPFRIALEAQPEAVMCAYNKLNGEYCAENKFLLKDVLRGMFGYEGAVVSDWGAVRDRTKSLVAGLDLAMPDSYGIFEQQLRNGIKSGEITEDVIDESLRRLLRLIDNVYLEPYGDFDADAHDRLSYNAAANSLVMLKNDNGFLPLTRDMRVLVCGENALSAPACGGGSSNVSPLKTISPLDAFSLRGIEVSFCRGYSRDKKQNAELYKEALDIASGCNAVVVYVGSPTPAEGVDRNTLELPEEQNKLIGELTSAGHRVVVVLCGAGPVAMPWVNRVRGIIYAGLNGQNGALAAVDALYGRINPVGKLAETFPAELDDKEKALGGEIVPYRESLFVGYKYYDAIVRRPLFPFGHGLSFSEVVYDAASVKRLSDTSFEVAVTLTNKSMRDTYEIVQVYVSDKTGLALAPKKQLAGFAKVFIEGQTTTTAKINIDKSAFEIFDVKSKRFVVPSGAYEIVVAASANDIKKRFAVNITGDYSEKTDFPEAYKTPFLSQITDKDFEALLGRPIPAPPQKPKKGEFTLACCIDDIKSTFIGKIMRRVVTSKAKTAGPIDSPDYNAFIASVTFTPLSSLSAMSDGDFPLPLAKAIVEMANGHYFRGIKTLIKK